MAVEYRQHGYGVLKVNRLLAAFKDSPTPHKALLIGAVVVAMLIVGGLSNWVTDYYASKSKAALIEKNKQLQTEYDKTLGEKKAYQLQAAESKMKADAILAAIEQQKTNVKLVDDKLKAVEEKYEQAKANLGDCDNDADCLAKLCAELRAAGFTCTTE